MNLVYLFRVIENSNECCISVFRVLDNSSDMATTLIGTPYYMSPELFSNKPYNHKVNICSTYATVLTIGQLTLHAVNCPRLVEHSTHYTWGNDNIMGDQNAEKIK